MTDRIETLHRMMERIFEAKAFRDGRGALDCGPAYCDTDRDIVYTYVGDWLVMVKADGTALVHRYDAGQMVDETAMWVETADAPLAADVPTIVAGPVA